MIFDRDPEEEALDEAFTFLEPTEWMSEVDKVVDAYKHEVDMLRSDVRAIKAGFKALEKKVTTVEKDFTPLLTLLERGKK